MPVVASSHEKTRMCVLTGFLGSGKTTILQRILPTIPATERVRVIVNDLSDENIDVYAFQQTVAVLGDHERGASLPSSSSLCDSPQDQSGLHRSEVTALSGGCVCCNLLADLVQEVRAAHAAGCTYVFIECTGVADPVPVVATLHALPALSDIVEVDAVVTVIGAAALLAATAAGTTDLSVEALDVMRGEQMKGANVVLINNWEYDSRIDASLMRAWVQQIKAFARVCNAQARVYYTNAAYFAFDALVYRQSLFRGDDVAGFFLRSYAEAGRAIGDFPDSAAEAGEAKKLGLQHFVVELPLCSRHPLTTRGLRGALTTSAARQLLRNVWRSKGYFMAVDDEGGSSDAHVASLKQFRWQTVGRKVDYGEVLPPYVSLTAGKPGRQQSLACRIIFIGAFDLKQKQDQATAFFAAG